MLGRETPILVKLECGCRIRLRDDPHPGQSFACPGMGHGYSLGWITSLDSNTGRERDAPFAPTRAQLGPKSAKIMDLIASGMRNRQIAAECSITENTLGKLISNINRKLGASSRPDAISKWTSP